MPRVALVHRHGPVAAVRDPLDVADHAPLEEAGRGLHRRLLGRLDLAERPLVDAAPALEGARAPRATPRAARRDRRPARRPRCSTRPGPGRPPPRRGPRSRAVSRSRTSTSSRSRARGSFAIGPSASRARGLLLDLEGGGIAQSRQRAGGLPADEPVELGGQAGRSGRRAPSRTRAASLRRRGPAAASPASCWAVSASAWASSASISDRPRSRRSISTSRSCCWTRSPRRSHEATKARTTPITATMTPIRTGTGPRSSDAGGVEGERRRRRRGARGR